MQKSWPSKFFALKKDGGSVLEPSLIINFHKSHLLDGNLNFHAQREKMVMAAFVGKKYSRFPSRNLLAMYR